MANEGLRTQLLEELKALKEEYEIHLLKTQRRPLTPEDVNKSRQELVASGQTVIDFFNKKFLPKYSTSQDKIVEWVGRQLGGYAEMASDSIASSGYFGLRVLFIPRGSKEGDPNELESMIEVVKKGKLPF